MSHPLATRNWQHCIYNTLHLIVKKKQIRHKTVLIMKGSKNMNPSDGLKNVTQFLMSLIGTPKNPVKYKTNNITDDYKIR